MTSTNRTEAAREVPSVAGTRARGTRDELTRFIVVGVLTVLIDFIAYRGMLATGSDVSWSKTIGFVTGTVFAYFANRLFTFAHTQARRRSVLRFALLYATTLAINVAVNHLVLAAAIGVLPEAIAVPIAFLCATGLSAILNFVGMKFFVFSARA